SVNPRGNDTLLTYYYLIRSGALAGGLPDFRKDYGASSFWRRCRGLTRLIQSGALAGGLPDFRKDFESIRSHSLVP
ncbi:hypothetical protein PIB30_104036, partial [Stylosanthes scabra]|nr:hypothetical protein [Stylosanthes scabra]